MSRFNTGNPLGSNDPRDLDDNAKNMDLAVNSEDSQWIDRFGRPRLPLMEQERQFVADQVRREDEFQDSQDDRDDAFDASQASREARFNDFIASSGYQFVGDYAPGIEITEYNQLIRDSNGEFWRVSGQVELPYVTTGAGVPEDDALVPAGDAVLRQDLANPAKGAAMVARGVVAVDSIADLLALPEGQRKEELRYLVKGYHAGTDVGGGEFYYDPSRADENDDGTVLYGFIRKGVGGSVRLSWFGARGNGISDDSDAIIAALSSGYSGVAADPASVYIVQKPIYIPNHVSDIDLAGAHFKFTREQQGMGFGQSLFFSYDRERPLRIVNGILEYTGTFDLGYSYNGYVSGIDISAATEFSGLSIVDVQAFGFNRAGILLSETIDSIESAYISDVVISGCNLHHNRVAGVWFGNVDGLILDTCVLEYNGTESDGGTGYGCSGIKRCYPKNIIVSNNIVRYNWRKGIDFHSGFNVTITGNNVIDNRWYGIWAGLTNDVGGEIMPAGSFVISNNIVQAKLYDPEDIALIPSIQGISAHLDNVQQDGSEQHPTGFTISNNEIYISGDSSSADVFPVHIVPTNFTDASFNVSGNLIYSDECTSAIYLRGPRENINGSVDVSINGNTIKCQKLTNAIIRLMGTDAIYSIKSFSVRGNCISGYPPVGRYVIELPEFTKLASDCSILVVDNTVRTAVYGPGLLFPLVGRGIRLAGNILNGKAFKEYNGSFSTTAPRLDGYYATGDRVELDNPTTHIGEICTTGGYYANAQWAAEKAYKAGDWVRTSSGRVFVCTVAGVSGASEPVAPPAFGGVVTDGGVSWTYRGTEPSFATFGAIEAAP